MTDQTLSAPSAPQFTIGHAVSTSFAVLLRNIVPFIIIAAIIAIPYIIIARLLAPDPAVVQAAAQQGQLPPGFLTALLIPMAVLVATSSLTSAALVYGTFQDLRGQKATIGDSLSRGLAAMLPVLVAAIIYGILYLIGVMLLVVPGIIVVVALWVYVPAIVVEKKGIGAAFTRSRELTKGRRWSILGLLLIVGISIAVLGWVAGLILGLVFGPSGAQYGAWVIQIVVSAFSAVLVAVSYYYLRADKEGIAIGDIAKVFD
jgi:hypothetical protein